VIELYHFNINELQHFSPYPHDRNPRSAATAQCQLATVLETLSLLLQACHTPDCTSKISYCTSLKHSTPCYHNNKMTAGPQLAQCRAEELLSGTVCDWLVVLPSLVAVLADHRVSVADPGFRLRGAEQCRFKV
jgi:hypothetical protein